MALVVCIHPPETLAFSWQGEYILSFDEREAQYWFLWPLFQELRSQTGQDIDLYGKAIFRGDDLDTLSQTIEAAGELTDVQPERWKVAIGKESGKFAKTVTSPTSRGSMFALLDNLQRAVDKAHQKEHCIVFWGD